MKDAILEYSLALEEHYSAVSENIKSTDRVRKAHYRLLKAKEQLRGIERELLEDVELIKQ